jgi:hypothetical protein
MMGFSAAFAALNVPFPAEGKANPSAMTFSFVSLRERQAVETAITPDLFRPPSGGKRFSETPASLFRPPTSSLG